MLKTVLRSNLYSRVKKYPRTRMLNHQSLQRDVCIYLRYLMKDKTSVLYVAEGE